MIHYLTEKEFVAINYTLIKQISPTEDFGVKDPSACCSTTSKHLWSRAASNHL